MRLKLILPVVKPDEYEEPSHYSVPQCSGKRFIPWQVVKKNVRDSEYEEVTARRYKCLRCGRTFLVYPQVFRLAVLQDVDVVAVPTKVLESWEMSHDFLERSAENRMNIVVATQPSDVGMSTSQI
jgi:hypothetical protein